MFGRLALRQFIKKHPPSRQLRPADKALLAAYQGILPEPLLALWRRKGLGLYGSRQIALIDPSQWQPVLDRWIVSPADAAQRIPIALSPFGVLFYYRRLSPDAEDVACLDPVSKATQVLSWSLTDFFNAALCNDEVLDALIPVDMLQVARDSCGALAAGQVYQVDETLRTMQMLKITVGDALTWHAQWRDAVDAPYAQPVRQAPQTIEQALPAAYCMRFSSFARRDLAGVYLSSYIDWHRMLALGEDGRYLLLFWRIDHRSYAADDIRLYEGGYVVQRNPDGETQVSLQIALRGDSLGSDANDEALTVMRRNGELLLLRTEALEDIATSIGADGDMGRSEHYFRQVTLSDAFPVAELQTAELSDLPKVLQALIHTEPLRLSITEVGEYAPQEEDEGTGTVMCRLSLGEADGLRMNMPLYSPAESGRNLKGWVWGMDPQACRAGIRYERDAQGLIVTGPRVGDELTTRAPEQG